MIYIFEGMDNCLKDTLIRQLRTYLGPKTHILKYSSPPDDLEEIQEYQMSHFNDMFNFISESLAHSSRNLILNRAHLGEYVYAPIYRYYEADWIFELEAEFLKVTNSELTKLILLYDSNNRQLRLRDDGKSLSNRNEDKLDHEREKFIEAFGMSGFATKLKFDLSDYYINSSQTVKEVDTKSILKLIRE